MVLHFCGLRESCISSTIMKFLRPSLVVTVCSDVNDDWMEETYIRFIDNAGNALMHEVKMTYAKGQHYHVIDAILILGRQSLACVLSDLPGLGLFDMQTGELRHVHQMKHHCGVGKIVHVPRESLIVWGTASGLSLFDDESLSLSGSIYLGRYVTGVLGGFTNDFLASCVVVGRQMEGLHIVNIEQRAIVRTISLPQLPVHGSINNLNNLSLAASGLQLAVTRDTHLYVVYLCPNEHEYQHHQLVRAPTCVSFVGDNRLVFSNGNDIIILDIISSEWLHQFHLRDAYFPRYCATLSNSNWAVVACLEDEDQVHGCLYKIQLETPYKVELICEDCVEALFLE